MIRYLRQYILHEGYVFISISSQLGIAAELLPLMAMFKEFF